MEEVVSTVGPEISGLMWVLMILVGALLIGGFFALMWWFGMPYGSKRGQGAKRRQAQRILDERFARGEIPKAEYERKRRELEA